MITPYQSYHEILSQRLAWDEAVRATSQEKSALNNFLDEARPDEIIFAGCTSPLYAATAAAGFWKVATGLTARALPSSELFLNPANYYPGPASNPVLVALSRSGKTSETLWAIEEFERRYPGRTILLSCNPQGPMNRLARRQVTLSQSAEKALPQTRSLSGMFLACCLMGAYHSGHLEFINLLEQAPSRADALVNAIEPPIQALLAQKEFRNVFVLGSGCLFGIAQEAALKCMEMSGSDAFSFPFLESRHGPRALVDEHTLVIGFYSHSGLHYEARLMDEYTRKHGATTLAIVPQAGWETGAVSATISVDNDWPDCVLGLAYLPVGHLAAYYLTLAKGLNPDEARNHTMYVEIERFS